MAAKYNLIRKTAVPETLRFDVTPRLHGQNIEEAFADSSPICGRSAQPGAMYKRVTDHALPEGHPLRVVFYRRKGEA